MKYTLTLCLTLCHFLLYFCGKCHSFQKWPVVLCSQNLTGRPGHLSSNIGYSSIVSPVIGEGINRKRRSPSGHCPDHLNTPVSWVHIRIWAFLGKGELMLDVKDVTVPFRGEGCVVGRYGMAPGARDRWHHCLLHQVQGHQSAGSRINTRGTRRLKKS